MRIVFITSKLNFKKSGGSVEEMDFIIRTLQKLGNEVTVVTAFSDANYLSGDLPYPVIEEKIKGGGLIAIQKGGLHLFRKYAAKADFFHIDAHMFMYAGGLYRFLGGKVPIVAFFNMFLTCWPQYVSSLFPQIKKNIILRLKEKVRWYIEKYIGMELASRIDLFSFVSPTLRDMYVNFGLKIFPRNNIVIGDPIDFKKIMAENNITVDSYIKRNKKDGKIVLFFSSRMSPGKGFDMFLMGFSKVKNKDNFKLILGGTGSEEPMVRDMIKKLSLEPYVILPGWVSKERLYQYYREADIFIQADWWPAGTSISLLYALIFGVPSILPGGGGLEWNAGSGAIYFKYRDVDDLSHKIEQLGADWRLREELSHNCYKRLASEDMAYEKHIFKLHTMLLSALRRGTEE